MDTARVFAGGSHLLILTPEGRLYGLMDNSHGAICKDDQPYYDTPHLMAEQVVSAAASARCSVYVTSDGKVHLIGGREFSGFDGASQVWAGMLSDTFWIRDHQGMLYCFGENHAPRGILSPWEKTYIRDLPQERCIVKCSWGKSDIQEHKTAIEQKLLHSEAFLGIQREKGVRNIGLELADAGSRILDGKQFFHLERREEHSFLPRIYYVNNYYSTPIPCPDQGYADTPHTEGCAPLGKALRQNLVMYADVQKSVHIRGYERFLLLLKDGSVVLADYRGQRLWENVFPEPAADISWGGAYMIVSFCSGRIAYTNAHTAYLRNLKNISLPAPVSQEADSVSPKTVPLPSGIFGGGRHFLLLEDGRMYGLGENDAGQISDGEPEYNNPFLMARDVISAAAGANYSIYVTSDGNVHLQGSGELAQLFPGFSDAAAVYAAQNLDRYYILDRQDRVYVFGENKDQGIASKDRTYLMDFTDDMIREALNQYDDWDPDGYAAPHSSQERNFWEKVLKQTSAFREAVKKYGSRNVYISNIDMYYPSRHWLHVPDLRRSAFPPSLYRTNALVTEPIQLKPEQAQAVTELLPVYMGCMPYALLPDGYEAESMLSTKPDAVKILCNVQHESLVLRRDKTLAVYNSWNGIYYAPYPSMPPVRDLAMDSTGNCLIAFETGDFYQGHVGALQVFSPRKRRHLHLKHLEDDVFFPSDDYFDFL